MKKIATPLTRFKEAHPSSLTASFMAIERLSGLACVKTYYRDPSGQFTVSRRGSKVYVSGDKGWTHTRTARNIQAAYVLAKSEAEVYQNWIDCWGIESKVTYTFGPYHVIATRNEKTIEWSVIHCSRSSPYKIVSSDMAVSAERAEIVLCNYLDKHNEY